LKKFRGNVPFPNLNDKIVIVVDDGLASGFSMLVTVKTLKLQVGKLIVAVPTAPMSAINLISSFVDKIFCANIRSGPFFAVATAYRIWYDLTDEDVLEFLKKRLPFLSNVKETSSFNNNS
jgi:predicted phosphoribosyltransferase